MTVTLATSNPLIAPLLFPYRVIVPYGKMEATFSITTHAVVQQTGVTISAQRDSVTKTANLTVKPGHWRGGSGCAGRRKRSWRRASDNVWGMDVSACSFGFQN